MDFWMLVITSALASGILTNLAGWLMSCIKNGFSKYEIKQGLYTLILGALVTGALVFTGANPIAAAAYAIPINIIITDIKGLITAYKPQEIPTNSPSSTPTDPGQVPH